jgi:SAM-dependent methyltransferase
MNIVVNSLKSVPGLVQIVRGIRHWRLMQQERMWDLYYGIHTMQQPDLVPPPPDVPDQASVEPAYEPTKYAAIRVCIAQTVLSPKDVFFDIGCGMGRVTCLFAREAVARCVGIEHSGPLADAARLNAARLRGRRAEIEIRTGDAGAADYSGGTIFWLYNPFDDDTMRRTLARLQESLEATPRRIQIIYVNPRGGRVFYENDWLQYQRTIEAPYSLTGNVKVSFWGNCKYRN